MRTTLDEIILETQFLLKVNINKNCNYYVINLNYTQHLITQFYNVFFTGVPERLSKVMKALMKHHDRSMNCNFILVLITRLRQICCHPALIKSMLDRDDLDLDEDDGSLFQRMSSTVLDMVSRFVDEEEEDENEDDDDESSFTVDESTAKNLMSARNPVFSDYRVGSKVHIRCSNLYLIKYFI